MKKPDSKCQCGNSLKWSKKQRDLLFHGSPITAKFLRELARSLKCNLEKGAKR